MPGATDKLDAADWFRSLRSVHGDRPQSLKEAGPCSDEDVTFALVIMVAVGSLAAATAAEPKEADKAKNSPKELTVDLGKGVKLEMVLIPAGEFLMGSPDSDKDADSDEKPQHRVRITKPFYLGKYLVTQEQWEAVMGNNPSDFKGPKNPVEQVSWDDCQKFPRQAQREVGLCGRASSSCPPRPNGNMPAVRGARPILLWGRWGQLGEYAWYRRTRTARRILLARRSRTPGGCTTCTGTCGSGARIGSMTATMRSRHWMIRLGLQQARSACTAAVAGVMIFGTAARRVAAAAIRSSGKVTKDSAYPKLRRTSEPAPASPAPAPCSAASEVRGPPGPPTLPLYYCLGTRGVRATPSCMPCCGESSLHRLISCP